MCVSPLRPSFTPKAELKKMPIIRGLSDALQSVYIERDADLRTKDRIVETLVKR